MKKIISIILLLIFVISIGASAAEYRVEWFDLGGDYNVYYSDSEVLILSSLKKDRYIMTDRNGSTLTERQYALVIPLVKNTLYEGIYSDDPENGIMKRHILDANGSVIKETRLDEIDEYSLYSPDKETASEKFRRLFEGEKPADTVYVFGKYAVCGIGKSGEYALADNEGNLLSDYIYDGCWVADLSAPDSIILFNDNEAVVADCIKGGIKRITENGEDYGYDIGEGYIPSKVIGGEMCIAKKNGSDAFFNRGNKVIDDCRLILFEDNYLEVHNDEGTFYYDIEGEKVFEFEYGFDYYGGATVQ